MNEASHLITAENLQRKAVIYIRQSTVNQVLNNGESRKLQHAMREHAKRLGWPDERVEVVESDTGQSGATTRGRDGYKQLLSDVAVGDVGIVLSYESTRLSRNCSDWYPLLDLCALRGVLIADRDGVYDPKTMNGRMLLGMKGILSEIELHTLRGRLQAGLLNKVRRGELALPLPVGLEQDGEVVIKTPDAQVQEAVALVFRLFLEHGSVPKVVRHLRANGVYLPKRSRGRIEWNSARNSAVGAILRNPAYAGTYTYGRSREIRDADGRVHRLRIPRKEWAVVIPDRYPAYVTRETFERIQSILEENYANYSWKRKGAPREGVALLQGIVSCGVCGASIGVQYGDGGVHRYLCMARGTNIGGTGKRCQSMQGRAVDQFVVAAFFEALAPAELDLYEQAVAQRKGTRDAVLQAQERDLERLRYECELASRRYERADPDNRNVAGELERRWEVALVALRTAETEYEDLRREEAKVVHLSIPAELRAAFASLGKSLPPLWKGTTLSDAQRKALLRALIDKVVLVRAAEQRGLVKVRIVWRGGAWSEGEVRLVVNATRDLPDAKALEAGVLELFDAGLDDEAIAAELTRRGLRSPTRDHVVTATVARVRRQHERGRFTTSRIPKLPSGYISMTDLAARLGVPRIRLYRYVRAGVISAEVDSRTDCRMFRDDPEVIEEIRAKCTRPDPSKT